MTGGRRFLFLLLVGLGGVAVLASLGTWQVQRLAWKTELIATLEDRLAQPPITITGRETAEADNFRRAEARGAFAAESADARTPARFLTSERPDGPGFRAISAFELETGETILVDRGFTPDQTSIPAPPSGVMTLTGALHWPREVSAYTPEPAVAEGRWFARDVPRLAEALGTQPVMLVLSAPADGQAKWPRPSAVKVNLPNSHLGYAITWYGLAAVWLAMSVAMALRARGEQATGGEASE